MHTTYDISVDFLTAAAKQEVLNREKVKSGVLSPFPKWDSFIVTSVMFCMGAHITVLSPPLYFFPSSIGPHVPTTSFSAVPVIPLTVSIHDIRMSHIHVHKH